MRKIFTLGLMMALMPGMGFCGQGVIDQLIAQKQEKMKKLEKCKGTTKNLKIAGISTLGITAVGVGANIAEAVVLNDYKDKVKTATAERDKQQKIKNDREEKEAAEKAKAEKDAKAAADKEGFTKWCTLNNGTMNGETTCVVSYGAIDAASYEDLLGLVTKVKAVVSCSNDVYDKSSKLRQLSCTTKEYGGNVVYNFDFSAAQCKNGTVDEENNTCSTAAQGQVQEHNINKIVDFPEDVMDTIDSWFSQNGIDCKTKGTSFSGLNSVNIDCDNVQHRFTFTAIKCADANKEYKTGRCEDKGLQPQMNQAPNPNKPKNPVIYQKPQTNPAPNPDKPKNPVIYNGEKSCNVDAGYEFVNGECVKKEQEDYATPEKLQEQIRQMQNEQTGHSCPAGRVWSDGVNGCIDENDFATPEKLQEQVKQMQEERTGHSCPNGETWNVAANRCIDENDYATPEKLQKQIKQMQEERTGHSCPDGKVWNDEVYDCVSVNQQTVQSQQSSMQSREDVFGGWGM